MGHFAAFWRGKPIADPVFAQPHFSRKRPVFVLSHFARSKHRLTSCENAQALELQNTFTQIEAYGILTLQHLRSINRDCNSVG
jgi:hypothetical protein